MELSSEEKARIEEDERRRFAEEQYRAEVRAKLGEPAPGYALSTERTERSKARYLAVACLLVGIGVLCFCGTHYVVWAKDETFILRKKGFQIFPLTLDVSRWTLSDVTGNPDIVFLLAQERKAYVLPGGSIIQALTDTAFAGRPLASNLVRQMGEAFGDQGQTLIAKLVWRRNDATDQGSMALTYLNKGREAYKDGKYPEAITYFQKSVESDPTWITSHLSLATAYMSQYVPGTESAENVHMAENAYNEFQTVLKLQPKNALATASIASLYFNQKKLDDAADWNKKLIEIDPKNRDAYYTLGVIAWTKWLVPDREARGKLGMRPEDPGPLSDEGVRKELSSKYLTILDEGKTNLEKALGIDPEFDEAMTYMNLLIRYRADLVDTRDEYRRQIETANGWVQKALSTKEMKANRVTGKH